MAGIEERLDQMEMMIKKRNREIQEHPIYSPI